MSSICRIAPPPGYRLVGRYEDGAGLVLVYQRLDRAETSPDRARVISLADRLARRNSDSTPPPSRRAA